MSFSHHCGTCLTRRFTIFTLPVRANHAETLRAMKPKAKVIAPECKPVVEKLMDNGY